MINVYSLIQKGILIFILNVIIYSAVSAAPPPTISLTVTPGPCPASGTITVNATGTTGSVFYAIKKVADPSFPAQQISNVFTNLETGNYIVAVYDDFGTTTATAAPLINAPYIPITASKGTGNAVVTGCDDDGSIDITIAGGNAPYTYKLKDGPTSKPNIVTNLKTARFSQLSTGIYSVDITDACGNTLNVPSISVTSLYNISSYDLKSFDMRVPTLTSTGCDLKMAFPTNNAELIAEDGTVLFYRNPVPGKFIPTGFPLLMKVEYPSGSGMYLSDWHTVVPSSGDIIPVYAPTNSNPQSNKFRILVKHPCNPNDTVFSQEYTLANPIHSRNGTCAPLLERTIQGYNCGAVSIKITNTTNPLQTKTYTWNDNGSSFPLDVSGLAAGSYSVQITLSSGFSYLSNNVDIGTLPPISMAFVYNYFSTLGCDFSTGGFRVYGIATGDTLVKTYSIISGPVTRAPIVGTDNMDLWTDLPGGTYQIKIEYGSCGFVTKTLTLKLPYNGFESGQLSYIPGTTCGQYHITGKAWYLAPDNSPSSTGNYIANVFNSLGTKISISSLTASNTQFTTAALAPGTYRITFQSSSHSQNMCSYDQAERTITIPPYIPLGIDVSNSGGIVCTSGFGDLHIDTIGGSGKPVTYRIKPKGAPDAAYTPYQSSPDFLNKAGGEYTAQVKDDCGYINTQDVTLVAAGVAAQIEVIGADASGKLANACQGNNVTLKLKVTGKEPTTITWTGPNGLNVNGKDITINNFSAVNAGKYFVTFTSSVCTWVDSISLNLYPKPDFEYAGSTVCAPQTVNLTTLPLNSGSVTGLTLKYYNSSYTELTQTTVSAGGTFHIIGTNSSGCSDTSTVNITINPKPEFAYSGKTVCAPETVDLTGLTLNSGSIAGLTLKYYDNGYTELTQTTVSTGGTFHIIGTNPTGCTDTSTVVITINPKPEFAYADSSICAPGTINLAGLQLISGSVTGLTLKYYDNGYTELTQTTISAGGTYHIIGMSASGCSDTSTVNITINPKPEFAYSGKVVCAPETVDLTGLTLNSGSIAGLTLKYYDNGYTELTQTTVSTGGTFHIIGTNSTGCTDTSTVIITINPKPEFAYADSSICAPGTINLAGLQLISGSVTGLTLKYYDNGYTELTLTTISAGGTYHIIGTSASGCSDTSTVNITINPKPEFTYSGSTVCAPETVDLTGLTLNSGSIAGLTLKYYDNGYTELTQTTVSTGGTYHIIGTNPTGCTDTSTVIITINPKPDFEYAGSTVCTPQTVDLTGLTLSSGSITGLTLKYYDNSYTELTQTTVSAGGTYNIVGTNSTGCTDTSTVVITINPKPEFMYADSAACAPGTVDLTGLQLISGSIAGLTLKYYDNSYTQIMQTVISSNGTYHIVGTNSTGCADTSTVNITINPKPEFTYGGASVCAPGTIDLTGLQLISGSITGLTLKYYDNSYTELTQTSVSTSGTYHIIGTNSTGCTDTSSVVLTFYPKPNFVFADSAACAVTAVDLTGLRLVSGSTAGLTLKYYNSNYVQLGQALATSNGTYHIIGTNSTGCADTSSVQITFNPKPEFTFAPNYEACAPATIDLTKLDLIAGSVTGLTLKYYDSNFVELPQAYASTSGTYYIIGGAVGGCTDTSAVQVKIYPMPTVTPIIGNNYICAGSYTQLTNDTPQGDWETSNQDIITVTTDGLVYGVKPGKANVRFVVRNEFGCSDFAQIEITVLPSPLTDFYFVSNSQLEYGFFDQTVVPHGHSIVSWEWNFGDGDTTSVLQNPTHKFPEIGTYAVSLTITLETGCSATLMKIIKIGTSAANFHVDKPQCLQGNEFHFTNTSVITPPNTLQGYLWKFGDGSTSTETNPVHSYAQGGNYLVELILIGSLHNDTTTQTVGVYDAKVEKPSDQLVCNGNQTEEVILHGTAEVYSWSGGASIGLADGEDNSAIPSFTAINDTKSPVTDSIYITPWITINNIVCYGDLTSFTITVSPLPEPTIQGDSLICGETPYTYTTQTGMNNYKWSVEGGKIVSGGKSIDDYITIEWNNEASEHYVLVNYANSNGCMADTPVKISAHTHPGITIISEPMSNQTICQGQAFELSVEASGTKLNYQWYFNDQPLPGETNPEYFVSNSNTGDEGKYYVTVYNLCGNVRSSTASVNISDLDIVVQKWNNVLAVKCIPEQNGGYQFADFQWYKNGELMPGETKSYMHVSNVNIDFSAVYVVRATTVTNEVYFTCGQTLVPKTALSMQAYPNPVKKGSLLQIEINSEEENVAIDYVVVNNMGQIIKKDTSKLKKIELTAPPVPGIYAIRVNLSNGDNSEFKIIVTE